jgi:predicted 3-demethylubiquinone-9 3-methyltransferase (glyoxalase superfamily)
MPAVDTTRQRKSHKMAAPSVGSGKGLPSLGRISSKEGDTMTINHKIIPHLWFDKNAEDAVNFYVSIFDNSKVKSIARYGDAGPGPKGSVMSISFELNGQEFAAINGGPMFQFNEAISFLIWCDTQAEIDALWNKLGDDGRPSQCGWLKDRFGLVWQISYARLPGMLTGTDEGAANRAMRAMMTMKKIDIRGLDEAYAGK